MMTGMRLEWTAVIGHVGTPTTDGRQLNTVPKLGCPAFLETPRREATRHWSLRCRKLRILALKLRMGPHASGVGVPWAVGNVHRIWEKEGTLYASGELDLSTVQIANRKLWNHLRRHNTVPCGMDVTEPNTMPVMRRLRIDTDYQPAWTDCVLTVEAPRGWWRRWRRWWG